MKRYIEANLLIQDIEQSRKDNNHNNAIASQTHNAEHRHFIKMVLDQPTTDVVEVVRCVNCKHWKSGEDMTGIHSNLENNVGECHCPQWENDYFYYITKDTDFCSYGDRGECYGN